MITIDQKCNDAVNQDLEKDPADLPATEVGSVYELDAGAEFGTSREDTWYVPYKFYRLS